MKFFFLHLSFTYSLLRFNISLSTLFPYLTFVSLSDRMKYLQSYKREDNIIILYNLNYLESKRVGG
jgi:hypothetical protein